MRNITSLVFVLAISATGCAEIVGIDPWGAGPTSTGSSTSTSTSTTSGSGGAGGAPPAVWAKAFPLEGYVADFDVGPTGHVIVTGSFTNSLDLGGDHLTSEGGSDLFVAEFDAGGKYVRSARFGGAGDQLAQHLVVDASGNVFLAGVFQGSLTFGGTTLTTTTTTDDYDVFVGRLEPSLAVVYGSDFGDPGNQQCFGLGVDDAGHAVLSGSLVGTLDFGGGTLESKGSTSLYVAATGAWGNAFGGPNADVGFGLDVGPANVVVSTGFVDGDVTLSGPTQGYVDAAILKFDAKGGLAWAARTVDGPVPARQEGRLVRFGPGGSVIAAGVYEDSFSLANGPAIPHDGVGKDVYVASLSAAGEHQWSTGFGGPGNDSVTSLAVAPDGHILLAGTFIGSLDLTPIGGGSISANGTLDAFLLELSADGKLVWSRTWGSPDAATALLAKYDATANRIVMIGQFQGSIDVEGAPLESVDPAMFVAAFPRPSP